MNTLLKPMLNGALIGTHVVAPTSLLLDNLREQYGQNIIEAEKQLTNSHFHQSNQ